MDEILKIVKLRLGLETTDNDEVLIDYINQIRLIILNYCRIDEVPRALFYVWAQMVISAVKLQPSASVDVGENGAIERLQLGDVSISYNSSLENAAASLISNHTASLNRFRKVVCI